MLVGQSNRVTVPYRVFTYQVSTNTSGLVGNSVMEDNVKKLTVLSGGRAAISQKIGAAYSLLVIYILWLPQSIWFRKTIYISWL